MTTSAQQIDDFADIAKPHKGAKGAAPGDDFADIAKPHPVDFTANENKQGTYEMLGPGGKKFKIPYGMIDTASQAGYKLSDTDKQRYEKDKQFEGQNSPVGRYVSSVKNTLKEGGKGFVSFLDPRPSEEEKQKGLTTPFDTFFRYPERIGAPNANLMSRANEEAKSGHYVDAAAHGAASLVPLMGPWAVQMGEASGEQAAKGDYAGAAGTLTGNAILAEAPKVGGRIIKGITKIPETARNITHSFVGSEPAEDLVKAVTKTNELNAKSAETQNIKNTKEHLGDTLDAIQKTKESEDLYSASEKARREKLDAENETDRKKFNESELERVKKEGDARLKALEDNKNTLKDYKEKVAATKKENAVNYRREVERQNVESKLDSASKLLIGKVGKAFETARKAYNSTWNGWRASVAGVNADMTPVVDSINAQEANMNPGQVALFRDILRTSAPEEGSLSGIEQREAYSQQAFKQTYEKLSDNQRAVIDQDIADRGINLTSKGLKEVPASRLHGWKSQLEKAVRTTTDGTVRYSIGQVLDHLRTAEETVSKSVGPKAMSQLAKARAITGPFFDAFYKSPEVEPKAAGQMLKEQTPEQIKERNEQDRVDRIAAYDPTIKSTANNVAALEAGLKSLEKQKNIGKLNDLPPRPDAKPVPPVHPAGKFEPTPFESKTPPDRAAHPDRPETVEAEVTKAGIDDLIKAKMDAVGRGAKWIRYRGRWIATSAIFGSAMIYNGLHLNLTAAAYDVFAGGAAFYATGKIADFLERPNVKKWLAQPTEKDIQVLKRLPPEQLEELSTGWKPIIKQAEANGTKVAPSLLKLFGVVGASQQKKKLTPQELLEQAHSNLSSQFQQSGLAPYTPTPPAKSGAAAQSNGTIKMKAPNGQTKDVPLDEVDHYKQKGAVVVQ